MEKGHKIGHVNMYRSGSLTKVARELVKYKLDLVDFLEIHWDKGSIIRAGGYIFFPYRKGNETHQLGTGFFIHQKIVSAINRVEFISDRM
jgi:hypothetical protein